MHVQPSLNTRLLNFTPKIEIDIEMHENTNLRHHFLNEITQSIQQLKNDIQNMRTSSCYKVLGCLWISNYSDLLSKMDNNLNKLETITKQLKTNTPDLKLLGSFFSLEKPIIASYSSKVILYSMISFLSSSISSACKSQSNEDETNAKLTQLGIVTGFIGSLGFLTNHVLNISLVKSLDNINNQLSELITKSIHLYTNDRTGYFSPSRSNN